MSSHEKVWLITGELSSQFGNFRLILPFPLGTSTGLGRALVENAVSRGDKVIATARQISKIEDIAAQHPDNVKVLQLDVSEPFELLSAKAKEAFSLWNRIDAVVNNAGFGCFGVIEEGGWVPRVIFILLFPFPSNDFLKGWMP